MKKTLMVLAMGLVAAGCGGGESAAPAKAPGSTSFEMGATSEKLLSNVTRLAVSFEDAPARAGATASEFVLIGPCVKLW
jgi:ABC-type glycerol-3-phosphate transport system substrate-binding protein